MADAQADAGHPTPRQRRRRRRRRRLIVGATVVVLVLGGAGTAWATRGSSGPDYRTATVSRSSVAQTVSADGSLSVQRTAALAFTSAGTVTAVHVAVGSTVSAGQVVATIDAADLQNAVTQAEATLEQAKQKLTSDEDAQSSGTSSTTGSSNTSSTTGSSNTSSTTRTSTTSDSTSTASYTALSSHTPTSGTGSMPTSGSSATGSSGGGAAALATAQQAVVSAQHALDKAVTAQDGAVKALESACGNPALQSTSSTEHPSSGGDISGTVSVPAVVTSIADDGTTKTETVTSANGGPYRIDGLDPAKTYTVQVVRSVSTSTTDCSTAVGAVVSGEKAVDSASAAIDASISNLTKAVAAYEKSAGASSGSSKSGETSTSTTRTGAGSAGSAGSGANAGSNTKSGTGASSSATGASTTITAAQLAADEKSIDAAAAIVTLRKSQVGNAELISPISGKVAAVAITSGDDVSASSSTSTITVVGSGALETALDIPAASIDLVKVGQHAQVTVDGHSTPYAAKVSYVGALNSSSSSGSSATYPVTVVLNSVEPALYDGMGATVSIAVGSASNVLTVPLSAVHTVRARHIVDLDKNGSVSPVAITEGTVGADRVEVTKGLTAGQQVVLADVGESVPSSTTTTNRRGGSSLTGGGFGGTGGGGFGGPPGGR